MEERLDIMTDNQWDAIIRSMMKVANNCRTGKDVVKELYDLLIKKQDEDRKYFEEKE